MDVKTQEGFLKALRLAEETGYFRVCSEPEKVKVCVHGNWLTQCKFCKEAHHEKRTF